MKKDWKTIFYFTKTERNGLVLFSFFCLAFLLLPIIFPILFPPSTPINFSDFEKDIALLVKKENNIPISEESTPDTIPEAFPFDPNTISKEQLIQLGLKEKVVNNLLSYRGKGGRFFKKEDFQKIYGLAPKVYQRLLPFIQINNKQNSLTPKNQSNQKPILVAHPEIVLQTFDPNTATKEKLLQLGISERPANTILNFRNKGGSFRKKEDFKKIFGITEKDYLRLEPYISISNISPSKIKSNIKEVIPRKEETIKVDINQATAENWQQLRGIGPGYAKKIIRWREKLGGFSTINQVGEAYGLPDSVFQKISPHLQKSPVLKTISINQIQTEDLQKHPYLSFKQAKAVTNYRQNHGSFKTWADFQEIKALSPETLEKIKPYINFD